MKANWDIEGTGDTPLEIYTKMLRADERRERRWIILAVTSFSILVIAIGVLIWAARLPKTVPLIISVSDWGEATYMGAATNYSYTGMEVPKECINFQLRRFVTDRYSLSSDFSILKQNIEDSYFCVTGECSQKLTADYRDNDPRKDFGQHLRNVTFESILQLSKDSYQVDFVWNDTNLAGRNNWRRKMRGVLTVKLMEPDSKSLEKNPLGIYITNFDFTELN